MVQKCIFKACDYFFSSFHFDKLGFKKSGHPVDMTGQREKGRSCLVVLSRPCNNNNNNNNSNNTYPKK
jgi:hypothetical protein